MASITNNVTAISNFIYYNKTILLLRMSTVGIKEYFSYAAQIVHVGNMLLFTEYLLTHFRA